MRFTYIKRPKVIKYQQPFGYSEHTVIFHRNKIIKNKNKKL